jgi:hypothetical protein
MPNVFALATVTATLKALLDETISTTELSPLSTPEVTARPPDAIIGEDEKNRLNLYPWKVVPNPAFVNERLPAYSGSGTRTHKPRLGLDMYYVLTATGASDIAAEILLGIGMQVLHEHPLLLADDIASTIAPPVGGGTDNRPAALKVLETSNLAEQVERIGITPIPATDEELGKIWPAFNSALRMSAFYRVSLALIEPEVEIVPGPPVREPVLDLTTLKNPRIARIVAQSGGADSDPRPGTAITASSRILVIGGGLFSDDSRLRIGGLALDVASQTTPRGDGLSLLVPATLPGGRHAVLVEHLKDGDLVIERSNIEVLSVMPEVSAINRSTGAATVTLSNPVSDEQSVRLFLNPDDTTKAPRNFLGERQQADATKIDFAFPDLDNGDYAWHVTVDGVASAVVASETFNGS